VKRDRTGVRRSYRFIRRNNAGGPGIVDISAVINHLRQYAENKALLAIIIILSRTPLSDTVVNTFSSLNASDTKHRLELNEKFLVFVFLKCFRVFFAFS